MIIFLRIGAVLTVLIKSGVQYKEKGINHLVFEVG